jgi:hypothetical protein
MFGWALNRRAVMGGHAHVRRSLNSPQIAVNVEPMVPEALPYNRTRIHCVQTEPSILK